MRVIAIDPGPTNSAWVWWDGFEMARENRFSDRTSGQHGYAGRCLCI